MTRLFNTSPDKPAARWKLQDYPIHTKNSHLACYITIIANCYRIFPIILYDSVVFNQVCRHKYWMSGDTCGIVTKMLREAYENYIFLAPPAHWYVWNRWSLVIEFPAEKIVEQVCLHSIKDTRLHFSKKRIIGNRSLSSETYYGYSL